MLIICERTLMKYYDMYMKTEVLEYFVQAGLLNSGYGALQRFGGNLIVLTTKCLGEYLDLGLLSSGYQGLFPRG
jgi:hypothetical protein